MRVNILRIKQKGKEYIQIKMEKSMKANLKMPFLKDLENNILIMKIYMKENLRRVLKKKLEK